jgi:Asp-tRNA(Asn)/Glu-tRNA(Gln) amidotransferase B subunit
VNRELAGVPRPVVDAIELVLSSRPDLVAQCRAGKLSVSLALYGKVMRALGPDWMSGERAELVWRELKLQINRGGQA